MKAIQSPAKHKIIGKPVQIKDAVQKVTGALKFGVDFAVPDMAYGKILRSPHSHAKIKRIDASKAEALPGVIGVLTHEDTPRSKWEATWGNYYGCALDGVARHIGDEVAAVAAVTAKIAEEALELIEVEYEILPAVFDAKEAMQPDAPQIADEGNVRNPYVVKWGDLSQGEAEADYLVEEEVRFNSQGYAPIGRNACVSDWDGQKLTVWVSSQTPSELQSGLHQATGLPMSKIRVVALPSGASFGLWWSNNFMMVTALLAMKIGQPVKIELTSEECNADIKRRSIETVTGKMGCTKDGQLTLAQFYDLMDNGSYGFKEDVYFFCCDLWGKAHHGNYTIQGVSTNLVTSGCMRGVGDITMGSLVERLADKLAEKVDMDPLEFRLKNQMREGEELRMQHSRETMKGSMAEYMEAIPKEERDSWPELFHLSSGDTQAILKRGAEKFRWKERWKGWRKPYAAEGSKRRAVGVGTGAHCCGVEFGGAASAVVRIHEDGSASVACAAGRHGNGSETTLAQIASEELGISFENVIVETSDTDVCPWNSGSTASTTTFRGGWATKAAAIDAKRQLLEIAAKEIFATTPDQLEVAEDHVQWKDRGRPEKKVTVADVLAELRSDSLGQTTSITGRPATPMPPTTAFARHFAAQFADVEVDIDTGEIKLLDYLACQDSGTVINPRNLKNQVIGGAIVGAGFALYEGLIFDEKGKVVNPNLLDYKTLRSADFPHDAQVLFHESPDPVGPFGARGAGEAPMAAATPAISQAVYNAIGVWVNVPMTPENVIAALNKE
jgi:CO/xanthine dehydrogenase Mo-binding subunit